MICFNLTLYFDYGSFITVREKMLLNILENLLIFILRKKFVLV